MEVDIVLDRHMPYELFVVRCLNCILSSRINPFSETLLQRHLSPLIDRLRKRKVIYEPIVLEVYLRSGSRNATLKIEEWSFAPVSVLEKSI